ncbi:MAG: hypothetical protein PUJ51_16970 [Clostridiales bacterium]|uniref:hypothetical protein n=1 Tax=Terrisporobacter sp. TaxID=1965305 RepID=UPI002A4EAC2B|nr:hypothetical protein [Terrisporobacter sp.]MDD7756182.1 hypothetical protein [Clostridiales bacterium]MDY4137049.1 hypothetical protein [Terrisporobacter sp.]
MALVRLLAGTNFLDKSIDFNPGTFYLDTNTGELWIDDPEGTIQEHTKIIDTGTLLYDIEETITYKPSTSNSNTAKLGTAVLGKMILGKT